MFVILAQRAPCSRRQCRDETQRLFRRRRTKPRSPYARWSGNGRRYHPRRYTFDVQSEEHVRLITGTLSVTLPGQPKQQFLAGQTYVVPRHSSFEVEAIGDVAYICYYR
jgi:hypothetical protein